MDQNHESIKKMKPDAQTIPWGIQDIGVEQSLEQKADGKKVKIALLDTGISPHPDLKIYGGISFVEGHSDYTDDHGHGTHVAGTIAALNNKIGVLGAAPESDVYAVKVLNEKGTGTYSQVIQGIDWAIENGMDIISMSFGGYAFSQALQQATREAADQGILLIAAAGNNGEEEGMETYPARFPEVISVGAIDRAHERAWFSSTGSNLDLVAPGVDILSTAPGGRYSVLSGTSEAVPHVTGAAAALWSYDKNLTPQDIKNRLITTGQQPWVILTSMGME